MQQQSLFKLNSPNEFKKKLLHWANCSGTFLFLDSNGFQHSEYPYMEHDCLVAVGTKKEVVPQQGNAFSLLTDTLQGTHDWLFGHLAYDLKNETEALQSNHDDLIGFPELYFFEPEYLFILKGDELQLARNHSALSNQQIINHIEATTSNPFISEPCTLHQKINKKEYIYRVNSLLKHIRRGDIYEANFCQEFYGTNIKLNPINLYWELRRLSPTPFSACYKIGHKYALSASPERFLKRSGQHMVSLPIKGTAARNTNLQIDETIKTALKNDPKERSENIMIVDLVRNDLSRVGKRGSVRVKELCQIYSFEQVHQMISTVECQVAPKANSAQLIKACFPMGSMTGAPKVKAMQLIEEFEESKRGLYSGSLGYFTPNGDFDLSVVIRSILYDAKSQHLSFSTGSAITIGSNPEKEYQECLLKAKAIMQALGNPKFKTNN